MGRRNGEITPTSPDEPRILASANVAKMRTNQVHAFLVGEAFMRAPSPGQELARLFA